jgi:hypothetical protein
LLVIGLSIPESDFYEQTINTNLKTLEKITNKKNYIEKLKELNLINNERYLFFLEQLESHVPEGTHKLEDPVSKITSKDCGGLPKVIVP